MSLPDVIWCGTKQTAEAILKDMEDGGSNTITDCLHLRGNEKIEFSYIAAYEMAVFRRVNMKRNNICCGYNRITYNQIRNLLLEVTSSS